MIHTMTDTVLLPALLALSFTPEESRTYIYLANHGAMNVSSLARGVRLSRITMHRILTTLVTKGHIKKITLKRRAVYEVSDPQLLALQFETLAKNSSQALTLLSLNLHRSFFVPDTKIYTGAEGINHIFDDIVKTLPKNGTYFRYTSRKDDPVQTSHYRHLRKEKEIERLVITSHMKAAAKSNDPNRFIKTVPKDFAFDDNVILIIYGHKIAHIDYTSLTGVVIESPQLARFQEKIFKLLWKRL